MALAAYGEGTDVPDEDRAVVDRLLRQPTCYPFDKDAYSESELRNCGVHTSRLHAAARHMSDRLFDEFLRVAETSLPPGPSAADLRWVRTQLRMEQPLAAIRSVPGGLRAPVHQRLGLGYRDGG